MTQPASVLSGDALTLAFAPTIGETLSATPGVSSTFFGPAASRPVIRGLGGDEDHAVAIDPALAERAATGRLDTGHDGIALYVDGAWRETDDYDIPGFAESRRLRALEDEEGEEHEQMRGTVDNSRSRTKAGGVGASNIGERWQFGVAGSLHDTQYGVPVAHGHGDEEEEEGGISIDLEQKRLDFRARGPLTAGHGPTLELRGALSDYEHAEIEPSGEIGTLFDVSGEELRAVTGFADDDRQATLGLQWQRVQLEATGEEAFVPGTTTRTVGVFGFQRREFDAGSLEYGFRLDQQRITGAPAGNYDENAVNLSLGAVWPVVDRVSLVGQLAYSERGVTAEAGLRFVGEGVSGEVRAGGSRAARTCRACRRSGSARDSVTMTAVGQRVSP